MADQYQRNGSNGADCGLFDFLKNKKDEDVVMADSKPSLKEKFPCSNSGSGWSSGEEEIGEDGVKRKKKGIMDKIKEKIPGHEPVPEKGIMDKIKEKIPRHEPAPEKGIMDKIKEKLPGHEPVQEKGVMDKIKEKLPAHAPPAEKGVMDKIKEKLPGQHNADHGNGHGFNHHEPNEMGIMDKIKDKLPGQHNGD